MSHVSLNCDVDCQAKEQTGGTERAICVCIIPPLFNTMRVTAGFLSGALRCDRCISIGRSGRAFSGAEDY